MLKTVGKRPASKAGVCEMKRILVPLLGDAGDRPALDMAAVVARRHGAHIDAMLFRRDPRDMIPLVGEGFNAAMIETLVQTGEIGRASCRERVCPYVLIWGVTVSLKKKHETTT